MATPPKKIQAPPATQRPAQPAEPTVKSMLEANKAQIAMALPKHMSTDRMLRIALTEINKSPKLADCDPISFCGAIVQAAQLGLEPGSALGHAYLVPFWNSKKQRNEVQLIPGYRGLIDLARRSGQIISISARVVYEYDAFELEYGLDERLVHVPCREEDPGLMIGAYAVAKLQGGGQQFEFMSKAQIDRIRDMGNKNPVWFDHYDEMARKTAVRRLFKYLPVSIELVNAFEISDAEEQGVPQNNAQVLIDQGVRWDTSSPVPLEANEDDQRREFFTRIENKIAERVKGGADVTEIEKSIGMALAKIETLSTDKMLAVWEIISK